MTRRTALRLAQGKFLPWVLMFLGAVGLVSGCGPGVTPSPTAVLATAMPTPIEATATPEPSPTSTLTPSGKATILVDTLNVRAGPAKNYAVLGKLKKGTVVEVTGVSADKDFYRIHWTDDKGQTREGWISTNPEYVQADDTAKQVAVVAAGEVPAPPTLSPKSQAEAQMAEALACWNVKKIEDIQGTPQNVAKFDCAKPKLLSIIQTYPNYADAHRLLAWGYFYKENLYPEAEQEYETAAQLYQKEGQTELAADMLARAAEVYFKEGNKDKAADVAKQALQLDPANTRATTLLRALASAYNADGNKDKACELLNLLLAIDPKNTSAASQKDSLGCK